ncbi:MAG TPA: hypothetical protein VGE74_12270, partial [Gemmata sp.]
AARVKQAKAAAIANLKKANIDKPTVVETPNYIVVGSLPEAKAKALGEVLEKSTVLARKALKFDDKESPWKGKLTVYFMPDSAEFKALMRRAFQVPPEGAHTDLRADPPILVDPAEVTGKATDADLYFNTAARVAGAHLQGKGTGTQNLPDWLRDGFGRVSAMRAEGANSKRYAVYKAQAKGALAKGGKLADVWDAGKSPAGEALGLSFADYLTYGPGAAKFPMILDALKPGENNQAPTIQQALEAAGLKDKDREFAPLEAAWKKWAAAK